LKETRADAEVEVTSAEEAKSVEDVKSSEDAKSMEDGRGICQKMPRTPHIPARSPPREPVDRADSTDLYCMVYGLCMYGCV